MEEKAETELMEHHIQEELVEELAVNLEMVEMEM